MARSFAQLAEVAVKKHNLEKDSLLVSLYCRQCVYNDIIHHVMIER